MDIRERLKEIEENLPGDLPDIKIAERYEKSVEKTNVDKLLNAFEKIKDLKVDYFYSFYKISSKGLKSINYSLKDIEDLCPVIEGDEDKIGIYISAAINKIIKDGEEVRLNFGNKRIDFIGLYLSKGKIIVGGGAGDYVGYGMKGGNINMEGGAGNFVGIWMEGGNINIEGGAGDYVGRGMKGGSISIGGNAGKYVGGSSEGGEIWIDGDYKSIGKNCKAKIYHKGKLVRKWLRWMW
ncbi:MAG: hypothetical protein ABIL89_08575 [candidate division WOR-3 bacterium]